MQLVSQDSPIYIPVVLTYLLLASPFSSQKCAILELYDYPTYTFLSLDLKHKLQRYRQFGR